MSLAAPAKPPVPAASAIQKPTPAGISPANKVSLPKFTPSRLNKKLIPLALIPIGIFLIILIGSRLFRPSSKAPHYLTSPTLDPLATASATPTSFIIPGGVPTEIPTPSDINWSRYIIEQAGLFYDYPNSFALKESSDRFKDLHPTWYDPDHYFDCINRQVGTTFPYPCWLFTIQLTTADSQLISEHSPGKLLAFPGNHQSYQDKLSRAWQIKGPLYSQNSQIYLAEIEINQITYQLDTQFITRSLDQYLRTHPERPFSQNLPDYSNNSLEQAHLSLLQQIMSVFQPYRKPLLIEPEWLRQRINNNWSIAYPDTWQIFTPNQADLPPSINFSSSEEAVLQGWYGNGNFVSFHQYSVSLSTPDLSQAPPSASVDIDQWLEYTLSQYPTESKEQVEIIGIPKRRGRRNQKNVEFETRTLLNISQTDNQLLARSLINLPVHQTLIWEFQGLPPRIVTIRQLDGLYEPKPMQQLLDTFVKRIYE